MTKTERFLIVLIIALVGGMLFWKFGLSHSSKVGSSAKNIRTPGPVGITEKSQVSALKDSGGKNLSTLTYKDTRGSAKTQELNEYQRSFALMAQTLYEFSNPTKSKEDLIGRLQDLGLKPIVAEDKQELIEDLTIIRTQNSLPGLRYVHVQYDGDGTQELQHMSFEIPKGPDAHKKAIELLQKIIPLGQRKAGMSPNIAVFTEGKYVIWVKELEWDDMNGDPFNAYEKSDIGNIKIAIEREVHGHEIEGEDHEGHEH